MICPVKFPTPCYRRQADAWRGSVGRRIGLGKCPRNQTPCACEVAAGDDVSRAKRARQRSRFHVGTIERRSCNHTFKCFTTQTAWSKRSSAGADHRVGNSPHFNLPGNVRFCVRVSSLLNGESARRFLALNLSSVASIDMLFSPVRGLINEN